MEESELKGEVANLKGSIAALEYARNTNENKMIDMEQKYLEKIKELTDKTSEENQERSEILSASVSKAHFDSVISALKLEHMKEIEYIKEQRLYI